MAGTTPPLSYTHPHVASARQVFDRTFPTGQPHSVRELLERSAEELVQLSQQQHEWVPILLRNWSPWRCHWDIEQLQSVTIDLDEARHTIAREHGFADWAEVLSNTDDAIDGTFESAVDAVTSGDEAQLQQLLAESPQLALQRSSFGHRATLLHYVAANGVEMRRQSAPLNVAELVERLVKAGADPDAVCNCYGGGPAQTPLCLAISSSHPRQAETIGRLVRTLCESGANVDGRDSDGLPMAMATVCGNTVALDQLAMLGARVDHPLTAAACGEVDLLQQYYWGLLEFAPTPPYFPTEYIATYDSFVVCLERIRRVGVRFDRPSIVEFAESIRDSMSEILDRYDTALARGEAVTMESSIPADWKGLIRKQALADLCAIDMDYRWQQPPNDSTRANSSADVIQAEEDPAGTKTISKQRWVLQDYLDQVPDLGPIDQVPIQLLVEEFRIRTEAGEALTVDDFLLAYPTRTDSLRPKLQEIEAEQRQLAAEIQLRIYHHQQLVYSEALEREVMLGRQRQGESEQYQRLNDDTQDRIVIASYRDRYVSREHVKLRPLPNGHVHVENCSKKNAISLSSIATLLLPGQFVECRLPVTIDIESRQLILKRGVDS